MHGTRSVEYSKATTIHYQASLERNKTSRDSLNPYPPFLHSLLLSELNIYIHIRPSNQGKEEEVVDFKSSQARVQIKKFLSGSRIAGWI